MTLLEFMNYPLNTHGFMKCKGTDEYAVEIDNMGALIYSWDRTEVIINRGVVNAEFSVTPIELTFAEMFKEENIGKTYRIVGSSRTRFWITRKKETDNLELRFYRVNIACMLSSNYLNAKYIEVKH